MDKKKQNHIVSAVVEGDFRSVEVYKDKKQVTKVTRLRPEDSVVSESRYLTINPDTKKAVISENINKAVERHKNKDIRAALSKGLILGIEVPRGAPTLTPKRTKVKSKPATLGKMRKVKVGNKTGYTRKRR